MAKWIKVGTEEDFSGQVVLYEDQENKISIFRLDDGYYAIDDTCSHEEASLAEGEIEDDAIECPLHGAMFDIRTGKNLTLPAVLPVKSYPVKVQNGEIFIRIEK